jgi:hypothetical protein
VGFSRGPLKKARNGGLCVAADYRTGGAACQPIGWAGQAAQHSTHGIQAK